jgi:hypothetical protein
VRKTRRAKGYMNYGYTIVMLNHVLTLGPLYLNRMRRLTASILFLCLVTLSFSTPWLCYEKPTVRRLCGSMNCSWNKRGLSFDLCDPSSVLMHLKISRTLIIATSQSPVSHPSLDFAPRPPQHAMG